MAFSKDLHDHRRNYRLNELSEDQISLNPYEQFERWFEEASKSEIIEPNSMIISTATKSGKPSSRVVLLKAFDETGFTFYTNYHSRKGKELEENNQACLLFFWDKLERQVRIEGCVEKVAANLSEEYFLSRPFESQLGATISEQSSEIPSRQYLEDKLEQARASENIHRPDNWGGYILKPHYFEFWQGRASRLHDRIIYEAVQGTWETKRLAP